MSPTPSTFVFWDIDGTLLSTARSGIRAYEDALQLVAGREVDLTDFPTSGLTDYMVVRNLLTTYGIPVDPETEKEVAKAYTDALPSRLSRTLGGALPGVVPILESLAGRDDVTLALLTGNMRTGAWAKLDVYGLRRFFTTGGFADDGFDRVAIGRAALSRTITGKAGDIYLVGDSPYDVACANALGLRMIAVATGAHSTDELAVGDPWWLLHDLPTPEIFLDKLGLNGIKD